MNVINQEKTTKKRDSLKRQTVIIIAAFAAALILGVLYFTVFRPMLDVRTYEDYTLRSGEGVNVSGCRVEKAEGDGKLTYSADGKVAYSTGGSLTLHCDVTDARATAGRYYMFPTIDAADIARIEIENEHGSYGFYLDETYGETYIIGCPGTPYISEEYSGLTAAARNPMSMKRVTENAEDLSVYGLDGSDAPAKYTITSKSGDSHTVLIGDMLVTGGGYYCTVEGCRAVYVMDTSMAYLLRTVESYVNPVVSYPLSETDYYTVSEFTLRVDGEVLVSCGFMSDEERQATASTSTYKMFVPENYVPSTANYGAILRKFTSPSGSEVLKFGPVTEVLPESVRAEYGLDKPKYEIYYKYKGIDNYIYVSEQNGDGSYYAYSMLFNTIVRVEADTFDFLRFEFIDFVDRPMFQKNINDVASIRIEGEGVDELFVITGDSQETLAVTPQSTGRALDARMLKNFRLLYRKMLGLTLEEYAPEPYTENRIMRMTVVTDVGIEYVYDFYAYSTRRCYFTINGEGEFYCLRDRVEQIVKDTAAVMNGEDIDVENLG